MFRSSLLAILLFSFSYITKAQTTPNYILVESQDTLSTILYSVGIEPLYGEKGSIAKYKNAFPEIFKRPLSINEQIPLLKEDVVFHENLEHISDNNYRIINKLKTIEEFERYRENRKNKKSAPEEQKKEEIVIAQVEEKTPSSDKLYFELQIGGTYIARSFEFNNLETKTKSNLQPYLDLSVQNWGTRFGLRIQPWLGGSEGLSTDYKAYLQYQDLCQSLICVFGLNYSKVGFISKNNQNERSVDDIHGVLPYVKIGKKVFDRLELVAVYSNFLSAKTKNSEKVKGHAYGVESRWLYSSRIGQTFEFERFDVELKSNSAEINGNKLSTALFWLF